MTWVRPKHMTKLGRRCAFRFQAAPHPPHTPPNSIHPHHHHSLHLKCSSYKTLYHPRERMHKSFCYRAFVVLWRYSTCLAVDYSLSPLTHFLTCCKRYPERGELGSDRDIAVAPTGGLLSLVHTAARANQKLVTNARVRARSCFAPHTTYTYTHLTFARRKPFAVCLKHTRSLLEA